MVQELEDVIEQLRELTDREQVQIAAALSGFLLDDSRIGNGDLVD